MDINKFPFGKAVVNTNRVVNLVNLEVEDIFTLLWGAKIQKLKKSVGEHVECLKGRKLVSLTKKSYITGRLAFEIAVDELCGKAYSLDLTGAEIEEVLCDKETLKSLSSLGMDAVVVNTAIYGDTEQLLQLVDIPVINTNVCAILAMLMTVWEAKTTLTGLKIAIVGKTTGDYKSLVIGCVKCGLDVTLITHELKEVPEEFLQLAKPYGDIHLKDNLSDGLLGADVVYMLSDAEDYKLDNESMDYAKDDAILLSAIPFTRDKNIASELVDGPKSKIRQQSANLIYTIKSALTLILDKD